MNAKETKEFKEVIFGDRPDMILDVLDFHKKFELPIGLRPATPEKDIILFKMGLIYEECFELISAVREDKLDEVLDAMVDLIYVTIGAAIVWGFPLEAAWREVHKANMKKKRGKSHRHNYFDIVKPKGWKKPDIQKILDKFKDGQLNTDKFLCVRNK